MIKELEGYNWKSAFEVSMPPEAVLPWRGTVSLEGVDIEAVKKVVAKDEGEDDGPAWVALFHLSDGRFVTLEAWCDYIGWDCQAGGVLMVSGNLEDAVRYGLTEGARERLGFKITPAGIEFTPPVSEPHGP